MRLLKRIGVDESWTWEQTLRRIVVEPMNKALETLAEKKAAFEKVSGLFLHQTRLGDNRLSYPFLWQL